MPSVEILSTHRTFDGTLHYCRHQSAATGTPMRFTLFLPPGEGPFPLLVWLSGLTCTEENFTTKGGAYQAASELGLAIVAPDTSPRGDEVADHPDYDFGQGAGFYVDATQKPWAPHFTMETYVVRDLLEAVHGAFPVDPARRSISDHSMGGHGALTLALRHPVEGQHQADVGPVGEGGANELGHIRGSPNSTRLLSTLTAAMPPPPGMAASFHTTPTLRAGR